MRATTTTLYVVENRRRAIEAQINALPQPYRATFEHFKKFGYTDAFCLKRAEDHMAKDAKDGGFAR